MFLLVVLVAGCTQQSALLETQQTQLVTKSVFEMLPVMNDLTTEWKFSGNGTNETINATGFDSGALSSVRKPSDSTQVVAHIYKFDSIDNANKYYQTSVDNQKQEGGYKEISTYGINANCYAGDQDSVTRDIAFVYCIKSNIVFYLRAIVPYSSGVSDDMLTVAKVIPSKIAD